MPVIEAKLNRSLWGVQSVQTNTATMSVTESVLHLCASVYWCMREWACKESGGSAGGVFGMMNCV